MPAFAAETDDVIKHAKEKLTAKKLDMIVANDVTRPGAGFNTDTNIASLITQKGTREFPLMSKRQLADVILNAIEELRNR